MAGLVITEELVRDALRSCLMSLQVIDLHVKVVHRRILRFFISNLNDFY